MVNPSGLKLHFIEWQSETLQTYDLYKHFLDEFIIDMSAFTSH